MRTGFAFKLRIRPFALIALQIGAVGTACGTEPAQRPNPEPTTAEARAQGTDQGTAQTTPNQATEPPLIAAPDETPVSTRPDLVAPTCPASHDTLLRAFSTSAVESLRPINAEPLVFDVTFRGGLRASFAPGRPNDANIPIVHAANYRIARFLDLENAVPTVTRKLSGEDFERLDQDARDAWSELEREMRWDDGGVLGAVACLSADVRDLGLARRSEAEQWSETLGLRGALPVENRSLYSDLSDLVILDYIVGNTRRVGSNIFGNQEGTRLLFGAPGRGFPEMLPAMEARMHRRHLRRTAKFSGHTLRRLSLLDAESLRRELEQDPYGSLLSDEQLWGVVDRALTAMSYAVSLKDLYGEQATITFP